jgi:DNA-binding transcriptional ArsR family regulator
MQYNHKIDDIILSTLLNSDKSNFAALKKKTGITGRTLSAHLKKLEEQNIITRDDILKKEWKFGYKRSCYLTEGAKQELHLGVFKGIETIRKSRSHDPYPEERKRDKLLQLVLLLGSSPIGRSSKKPNWDARNMMVFEKELKDKVPYEVIGTVEGIAISELLDKNVHLVLPLNVFTHIQFTKTELEDLFGRLQVFDPPLIKPVGEYHSEYRYLFSDNHLRNCIRDIWSLFTEVWQCLSSTWKYVRTPKRKEWEWFCFFFGDSEARLHFTRLAEERQNMINSDKLFEKLGMKNTTKEIRRKFLKMRGQQESQLFESQAKIKYQKIKENYMEVIMRYPKLIRTILDRVCKPLSF